MKLLLDEHPLLVLPSLAQKVGLNESIILQQLHYWLQKSDKEIDGKKWVYATYEQLHEQFPFWSIATIRRIIANLEKQNYILTANYNHMKIDKTKWYSINYSKIEEIGNTTANFSSPCAQNEQSMCSICADGCAQFEQTNNHRLPETTTETTNISTKTAHIPYEEIQNLYNEICKSLPKVKILTDSRKKKIKSRYEELKGDIDKFKLVFTKLEASDFCKGKNDRGWKANFDWLFENDTNVVKVLEGRYDNKQKMTYEKDAYKPWMPPEG